MSNRDDAPGGSGERLSDAAVRSAAHECTVRGEEAVAMMLRELLNARHRIAGGGQGLLSAAGREPTDREWQLAERWCVYEPHATDLACHSWLAHKLAAYRRELDPWRAHVPQPQEQPAESVPEGRALTDCGVCGAPGLHWCQRPAVIGVAATAAAFGDPASQEPTQGPGRDGVCPFCGEPLVYVLDAAANYVPRTLAEVREGAELDHLRRCRTQRIWETHNACMAGPTRHVDPTTAARDAVAYVDALADHLRGEGSSDGE